ncbi:SWI5-dependent HO expression protein 4 [Fusarium falciforme]|uniref:SWI5-dependent HO expression protein 4 n=1 Tax=Fusarium falciforme TaxID=195108 RepID=A0A9W8RAD1_9HYPO|nr:SWI5-dependent HO expression protein 4 [Fusarium falciforme]KAJ4190842.1 SWI5-dependent HO expression protein 4 [Fusarium falciforme]KAJ4202107.1 SWI5-dependent HO expression protein 4 [Fusarium falciforme]KAJ4257118.1 SWI5-dependent HO expression protein 4 [Fusarium falciforme]
MAEPAKQEPPAPSLEDQTLIVFARLMEGGQEDNETCRDLDELTKLLNDDYETRQKDKSHETICKVIDGDCVDTVLCYLDMRQPEIVRGHATLSTSAYLKAAGDDGSKKLSTFFFDRVRRGTYDDYIVAFCVAAATFPIVPDLTAELFLNEDFLPSLGTLMRRKWKSRKVETACLEMLNAACMNSLCREAINKYCIEWLEEIVDQDLSEIVRSTNADPNLQSDGGSITMRRHSEQVQYLAAVILAKLRAVPAKPAPGEASQSRIEPAVTSIEDLSGMFTKMILRDEDHGRKHSIEGLAYASLQPKVKESIVSNPELLQKLVKTLSEAQPRSPTTYGALSIFVNLTKYLPNLTEEEKKMNQLKAYANAAGKLGGPDPLNDDEHVAKRCKLVFDAGITPVLVTHSKNGSPASLSLVISIIFALSVTKTLRGQLAQQGAVKLLLTAWMTLPQTEAPARRLAAQALARILISTNPALVFGGNRSNPISAAIRPLVSIVPPDPAAETRDLLPSFEALMALTNLASMDDEDTRRSIIATAWFQIEEQMLSSNALVSKAAVELVCNLVQAPEAIALYAEETAKARNRLHILLALADAEDAGTRSAAGGALASLTSFEGVIRGIINRERGIKVVLSMCVDDDENIRHRGVFVVLNLVTAEGEVGELARQKIKDEDGVEVLKECLKKSRRPEVLEVTVQALKALLGDKS